MSLPLFPHQSQLPSRHPLHPLCQPQPQQPELPLKSVYLKLSSTKAKYRAFIIQCYLYMAANTKDINDDAKKISFVLSYMKAGTTLKTAESWKNRFVEKYLIPAQPPTLPSYSG
jgi:hypothetical protein